MPDNTGEARRRLRAIMGDAFAQSFSLYGFNEVAGRLYAALFFADAPRSLDDFVAELGISKTTASVTVRYLLGMGLARKVWQPGRKEYYLAERDFSGAMLEHLREVFQKECALVQEALAGAKEVLAAAKPAAPKEALAALETDEALLTQLGKAYRGWGVVLKVMGRFRPGRRGNDEAALGRKEGD